MIFLTVGAQMPFDRLVRAVDAWADANHREDVFAQIGPALYEPRHCTWTRFLGPPDFRTRLQNAKALVAHAGTGSILNALELGKPILVMPRRADLRETRNDHQIATARRFAEKGRVLVAMDESELALRLCELEALGASAPIAPVASAELIAALRDFVLAPR